MLLPKPQDDGRGVTVSCASWKNAPYALFILLIPARQPAHHSLPLPAGAFPPALADRDKLEELAQPERAGLVAPGGGSWEQARELASSEEAGSLRHRLLDLVSLLWDGDQAARWLAGEELEKDAELPRILEQLRLWFRDLLVWKLTGQGELLVNQDQLGRLGEMAEDYSTGRLVAALEALGEAQRLLTGSANTRLVLDVLFGKLEPDRPR